MRGATSDVSKLRTIGKINDDFMMVNPTAASGVAETILASVHVRARKQAGHMEASDLIKSLQIPCEEGYPQMENQVNEKR